MDKKDDLTAVLTISLSEEDYKRDLAKKVRDTAAKAQLKGFRPGKVPVQIIEKMYGKSLKAETIDEVIGRETGKYISENVPNTVGRPVQLPLEGEENIDLGFQKDFKFSFELGTHSDVNLGDFAAEPLKEYKVSYSDDAVEKFIDQKRKSMGKYNAPEETAAGDLIFGQIAPEGETETKYTGFNLDKVVAEHLAQFIGKKAGESVTFNIEDSFKESDRKIVAGISRAESAEKEAKGTYTLNITSITRTEPAELNEAFFHAALPAWPFPIESEEAFKIAVKETLEAESEEQTEALKNIQLRDTLIANTPVSLPEAFVKRWLLSINEPKQHAEIISNFDQYLKAIKWEIIQGAVAKEGSLDLTDKDIEHYLMERIEHYFNQAGRELPDHHELHQLAHQQLANMKENERRRVINNAFEEKIYNYLKEKATWLEETVDEHQLETLLSQPA